MELASLALRRDPFHADSTAVLVKALVALGGHRRARDEVTKCADLYHRELGLSLPAEVRRALSDSAPAADPEITATAATVRSYLDAGSARILAIQGMLASDTAHYGDAVAAFAESRRLARAVRNRRQLAFSEALLGRVHLLRGDLELAAAVLDRALDGIAEELDRVRAVCRRRPR